MNMMPKASEIGALRDELRANGVRYVMGAYVDIHGAQKGKVVPLDHLAHMAEGSELYTGYALDGLGQLPNDDEFASVPDLDRVIQLAVGAQTGVGASRSRTSTASPIRSRRASR